MSIKKIFLFGFLIILMVVAVFFAVTNIQKQMKISKAKQHVATARSQTENSEDAEIARWTSFFLRQGLATGQIAASKTDTCYLGHTDQGWTIAEWYQNCTLRYVVGFSTELDQATVLQKIGAASEVQDFYGYFGAPTLSQSNSEKCKIFERNYSPTIIFRAAGLPAASNDNCAIPDQAYDTSPSDKNHQSIKTYSEFDYQDIDNSKNQIWIIRDVNYYKEDIGCEGFFCDSPRDKPVQAP